MRYITIIFFYFLSVTLSAQPYTIDLKSDAAPLRKSAIKKNGITYNFSYPGIILKEINTSNGVFNQMFVPNTYRAGKLGEPQLISTQKLISIPAESQVKLRVISYTTEEFEVNNYFADNRLIPYQPSYSKNVNIQDKKFVMVKEAYQRNSFSDTEIASVKILGTLRDKTIAKITINPTSYNPVTNTLKFYNHIEIELIIESNTKAKPVDPRKTQSPYFNSSYQKIETVVIATNYTENPDLTKYPTKYLVVAPNNYIAGLQDFIKWKTQKGFEVVLGNLDEIGSSASAIKTWVHNQYNSATIESPAPSFLLLVGDIQQVPTSQNGVESGKATDLYYASVDGDMFPDMYYGRLPAQDTAQLNAMLAKTIQYEKYEFVNDDYLDDVTLIAGADATWNPRVGQPTLNYGTTNYFNAAHGFNNVNAYLTSYTGCYNNDTVSASLVNYTAHCSQTSWTNPPLGTTTAKTFGNAGEYALAIGNCCQSGDFSIPECMGEAWIRNPNAGAIAYLGSVPDTYWWEDFYWSVGAHNPVYNQYPDTSASSLGVFDAFFSSEYHSVDAMVFVGNLAVTEAHNEGYYSDINSQYYWEAYHCLGDPSLIPYLTKGLNNIVSHDSTFHFGIPEFSVKALPGSTVALSNANGLIGTAITGTDSMAIINTDTLTLVDLVTLVVTKPKYKPHNITLPVGDVEGTYLTVENIEVNDSSLNGKLEFGEQANLEITLKNIGNQTAENIWVSISSTDSFLENFNLNTKIPIGNIYADQTQLIVSKFNFSVKDSVPDQHNAKFKITLSDSISGNPRTLYSSVFYSKLNAPQFEILPMQLVNDFSGNGNFVIDYGETATLQLAVINKGNAIIETGVLLSNISVSGVLQLNTTSVSLGQMGLNDTVLINFEVHLPLDAETKAADSLLLKIEGGYYFAEKVFAIALGQNLFTEIGKGNLISTQYPFYNYYLNNSSQLLYLGSEMGNGVKAIKSIAFNVAAITSNSAFRDLKNFNIKATLTDLSELVSKVEMTNAPILFNSSLYYLPDTLGWEKFDFQQNIIIPDNKNIVFEICWGENDNYAPENNSTSVYSTTTNYQSVVWGANDDINPAPINESSYKRPNSQFEFDSVGILNITVEADLPVKSSTLLADCNVTINSETKLTDDLGRTQFYFLEYSGTYNINFSLYGYYDSTVTINKTNAYEHIQIQLNRHPELTINVKNTINQPIENAAINLGGFTYYTNTNGQILSYATPQNQQAVYSISKTGYYVLTDSVFLDTIEKSITITLIDKLSDAIVAVKNTKNEPISGVEVIINSTLALTDSNGIAIFNGIIEGNHTLQLYHPNFEYFTDSILIGLYDTSYTFTLKTIGNVLLFASSEGNYLEGIDIKFDDVIKTTDSKGMIEIQNVTEGIYEIWVNDQNHYPYSESIQVFGKTTTAELVLQNKADVTFFIHNGDVGLINAHVIFDTLSLYSDTTGLVFVSNVLTGTYEYIISADGYYPLSHSLELAYADTVLNLEMTFIPDLTIELYDEKLNVQSIPVYFENDTLFANQWGKIELIDIGSGTFYYTINQPGYYAIYDSVVLESENDTRKITLTEIPDLNIIISAKGNALDSVKTTLNNEIKYSNVLGLVYFDDLYEGEYIVELEKEGYFAKSVTFVFSNADTTVYCELVQIPDLKFTVLHQGEPVENAKIAMNNLINYTDAKGEVIVVDLLPNQYVYSVEKTGLITHTDTLVIEVMDYHEIIEMQQPEFSVVFTITNGIEALENAQIIFNKSEKLSDVNGKAEFNNFIAGDRYNYVVSKEGYSNYYDSITIVDKHLAIDVTLQLIKYSVQFKITDEFGLLSGVNVNFDNKVKVTDLEGIAVFNEILPSTEISYYLSKSETHIADSGFISLTGDTIINVQLFLLPEIIGIANETESLRIYPNPTQGQFYIEAEKNLIGADYTIFDNYGKVVLNGKITEERQIITLKGTHGVYHISLKSGEKLIYSSIIIL